MNHKCVGQSQPRCFETPNESAMGTFASDRIQSLRRRTLYESTACQTKTKVKKNGNTLYDNIANGDLRLYPNDSNGCLQFSYSHSALLDANIGKVISQSKKKTAVELREIHKKASTIAKHGSIFETTTSITSYTDGSTFLTDTSFNAGKRNKIYYDPTNRLTTASGSFPGMIVDPSQSVMKYDYNENPFIDICMNSVSSTDMSLNRSKTTTIPYIYRRTRESATFDACFSFPSRLKFS